MFTCLCDTFSYFRVTVTEAIAFSESIAAKRHKAWPCRFLQTGLADTVLGASHITG